MRMFSAKFQFRLLNLAQLKHIPPPYIFVLFKASDHTAGGRPLILEAVPPIFPLLMNSDQNNDSNQIENVIILSFSGFSLQTMFQMLIKEKRKRGLLSFITESPEIAEKLNANLS